MYNKHNLAVAKIASKSKIKPALAGVLFTDKCTVATDSFRLIEITVPTNVNIADFPTTNKIIETTQALVDAESILKIKLPKSKHLPIVEHLIVQNVKEGKTELITTDIDEQSINTKEVNNIQDGFPDYKQIIPQGRPTASVTVSAKFLSEVLTILGDLNTRTEVTLELRGENEAIIIRSKNDVQEGLGIVMPIHK
jgi:hypothetical protein